MRQSLEESLPPPTNPREQTVPQDRLPIATLSPEILRHFTFLAPDAAFRLDPLLQYLPQREASAYPGGKLLDAASNPDQHQSPPFSSGAFFGNAPLQGPSSPLAGLDPALQERLQEINSQGTRAIGHSQPDEALNPKPYAAEPAPVDTPSPQALDGLSGTPAAVPSQLLYPVQDVQAIDGKSPSNLPAAGPGPHGDSLEHPAEIGQGLLGDAVKMSATATQYPYEQAVNTPAGAGQALFLNEPSNPAGSMRDPYGEVLKGPAEVWQGPHGFPLENAAEARQAPIEEVAAAGLGLPGTISAAPQYPDGPIAPQYPDGPIANSIQISHFAAPELAPSDSPFPGNIAQGPSAQPQIVRFPVCQGRGLYTYLADPTNRRGFIVCGGGTISDTYNCCIANQCYTPPSIFFIFGACLVRPPPALCTKMLSQASFKALKGGGMLVMGHSSPPRTKSAPCKVARPGSSTTRVQKISSAS